jgi:hypothetical protein
MNRIHGAHGQIGLDRTAATTTPTYITVGSMNKWTLNMARDRVDVTAFGDTTKVYVQGLADVKGTLGGWFDTDDLEYLYAALAGTKVGLKLTPTDEIATIFFSGLAFIDGSVDVAANGAVSVSGSFAGAGPWTLQPPEVP